MSRDAVAWVLNLDADIELAAGKGYSPSKAVLTAMAPQRAKLAASLLGPTDTWLDEESFGPRTGVSFDRDVSVWGASTDLSTCDAARVSSHGRAFCPTPRALARMRAAGVEPEPHPSFEVLRRVNGRAFCAELGQPLGGVFVTRLEDAIAVLAAAPPIGRQWRAKRAFGMAGRGQRPIAAGVVSEADQSYLAASIAREGGIQLEPEVEIVREVGMHGLLAAAGAVELGPVVEQQCDASGQWLASVATNEELPELVAETRRIAAALHGAGYFGPFGVDAFFYRANGDVRFQPRSEINARYSMGFAASGLRA